ncbi:DnaJ domain protein [Dictyocaulus viviparus]|uniref:DnaJ domain protein n=1 Tax=Dictyocaulus viviparus TaxID=29172 RepID=A0A0D8XVM5_DICVI|nr:DnaJ domain protein [Dictyocaulus viviparus]
MLFFVLLLSLKLDNKIKVGNAILFLPIWIYNSLVFIGAFIGMASFLLRPPSQNDHALRVDFTAMQLTTVEHLLLFLFALMTYFKLELPDFFRGTLELHWIVVFSPLFTLSVASIGLVVWAMRRDKSFEFELFFAINIVQLFFLAFKLDNLVDWSWAVVFIPLWVVLSLSAVGVLYALVLSIVLARSRHLVPSHRRRHVTSALFHACLVVPALICMVLLTGKLDALEWNDSDSTSDMPFTLFHVVFSPLLVSLLCLVLMSCVHGGGNVWWFGLRQPFCSALLDSCPCLKQYANVSYKVVLHPDRVSGESTSNRVIRPHREELDRNLLKPAVPLYNLDMVSTSASFEEIKRAYFAHLRKIHPDKGTHQEVGGITLATHIWSILKSPEKRQQYDYWLREQYYRKAKGSIAERIEISFEDIDPIVQLCRCGDKYEITSEEMSSTKIIVVGESGVGKTSFVNAVCGHPSADSASTIGASIAMTWHEYKAEVHYPPGTSEQRSELMELWDIGGSGAHRAASVVFFEGTAGAILNLSQWLSLLDGRPRPTSSSSRSLLADIESCHIPILTVGCKLDLAPHRGPSAYNRININCLRPIPPGSTASMALARFFDETIERTKAPVSEKRRRVQQF